MQARSLTPGGIPGIASWKGRTDPANVWFKSGGHHQEEPKIKSRPQYQKLCYGQRGYNNQCHDCSQTMTSKHSNFSSRNSNKKRSYFCNLTRFPFFRQFVWCLEIINSFHCSNHFRSYNENKLSYKAAIKNNTQETPITSLYHGNIEFEN